MNKCIFLLLIPVMLVCNLCHGQETDTSNAYRNISLKVNYFGELVLHPGFTAGIDYTLYQNNWFNLHWDSELGMYFHKWNNNALFLQSTIGTRYTTSFSAFVDINIGVGYMLTTPNGDVYSVDDNGELSLKGRPYYSHFKPTLSILFGWDGTRKRDIPLLIQAGIEAYLESNFNQSMLPHGALRVGIIYRFKKK